jgi:hypothetical protein
VAYAATPAQPGNNEALEDAHQSMTPEEGRNQNGDRIAAAANCSSRSIHGTTKKDILDDVDFGWQIAGHFEANFLLANLRLVPDFHNISSIVRECHANPGDI